MRLTKPVVNETFHLCLSRFQNLKITFDSMAILRLPLFSKLYLRGLSASTLWSVSLKWYAVT